MVALPSLPAAFHGYVPALMKDGYNRCIYLLTHSDSNKPKLILKQGKATKDSGSSQAIEAGVQRFLEAEGVDFTPRVAYWDADSDCLIETCVGSSDVPGSGLSDNDIKQFARQLYAIHALSTQRYVDFAKANGYPDPVVRSPIDSLRLFGYDRLEVAKKGKLEDTVVEWLETHLEYARSELERTKDTTATPHIEWGDPGDMRRDATRLFFVDWEFSQVGYSNELSYIKIHGHLTDWQFDQLVRQYAAASGISPASLHATVLAEEKIARVSDVVWAAMKWSQAKNEKDRADFEALTYRRMRLARAVSGSMA